MLTLTVALFNGTAYTGAPLSASFGEAGGTVGRADNNLLVLPDPDRTISRLHAQLLCRSGRFFVIDRGSNPIHVNGQPLAPGAEQALSTGDELQIGGYVLRASAGMAVASAPTDDDIFASLFGGSAALPAYDPLRDPFAAAPAKSGHWPAAAAAPPDHPLAQAPRAAPKHGGIPDDWDPFGQHDQSPAPQAAYRRPAATAGLSDIAQGLGRPAESSLDDLFGLQASSGDPLQGSAFFGPASAPNTAANADPLRSLDSGASATLPTEPDWGSDLYTPMPLPRTKPSAGVRPAQQPGTPLAAPASPAGQFAWGGNEDEPTGHTIIRPVARAKHTEYSDLNDIFGPAPVAAPAPALGPPASRPPAPPAPAANGLPADEARQLLQALQQGLGLEDDSLGLQLSPVLMLLLGTLLRESMQGTVDLLVARAAFKREVRADVTMIAARENNPLKFSPSGDVALRHLLGKPTRGFMAPDSAIADAYQDLRAHQFGMLAGMRAALEGVLTRFDPVKLEGRLTQKSVLGSLMPATRKARMWELFNELYAQIRGEAADDFHELFGKAFLQAYEAHIDELQQKGRP